MKQLKIAILAQLESPTITEQLAPTLRDRGHTVDILDLSEVPVEHFVSQPEIKALATYDLIYYRSGLDDNGDSEKVILLEAFLKDTAVKTVNLHYTKHPLAHSKIYETKRAAQFGLKIPRSVFPPESDFDTISKSLDTPFVSKTDYGTNGKGVRLIRSEAALTPAQQNSPDLPLLFQEFIAHDFEYRVHIMNGEIVCIWKKEPPAGDFRSNEAQGGAMLTAEDEHTELLTKLATKTYTAFDFDIYVADFMLEKHTNQFYFTEINLNPGWGQTDLDATGVDVIGITADYFEEVCS